MKNSELRETESSFFFAEVLWFYLIQIKLSHELSIHFLCCAAGIRIGDSRAAGLPFPHGFAGLGGNIVSNLGTAGFLAYQQHLSGF